MKNKLTREICRLMDKHLTPMQNELLKSTLNQVFSDFGLNEISEEEILKNSEQNNRLIQLFIAAKKIEGCSENTLKYYSNTLISMSNSIQKNVREIETNDLRFYLSNYQNTRHSSKVTLDNIRRIMSSFVVVKHFCNTTT